MRLWPQTVMQALFPAEASGLDAIVALAGALELPPSRIHVEQVADRPWEREWLKDFHSMRFGRRLWIVPNHEALPTDPQAVSVRLDPASPLAPARIRPPRYASPGSMRISNPAAP
ncbi:MAG: 50S ribosomal protein L11 methyltransferase [Pseudomonadota bacterium]